MGNKSKNTAISVSNVFKSFIVGDQEIKVLKDITFSIDKGDFVIILGPSGCGKSTLLHLILGLEPPTSGEIKLLDFNITANTDPDDCARFRKDNVGIVYQQSNWIKSHNVRENVAFPLLLRGYGKNEALNESIKMLKMVDMLNWSDYVPTELSSGQQQRVALARAMINNPEIIFADEPTGNLDFEAGQKMMQLFLDLNQKYGKTVVMVTHDLEYLSFAKSALRMFDGKLVSIVRGDEKRTLEKSIRLKKSNVNETV